MERSPELPAAYELIHYREVNDLRAQAINLAKQGAQEGTLIWASSQSNARGRLNQKWQCNHGDLHCTIILRPDYSADRYAEIMVVAAVSLAHALATHLSAMTALGFGWPNDITIAALKVGSIWVDASRDQQSPWLAVTASVNIENSPDDFSISAISVREAEGETGLNSLLLLETYARQFITQINSWSERGSEFVLRQWLPRIECISTEKTIRLDGDVISGIVKDINTDGGIKIEMADQSNRTFNLSDFVEFS